MKKVLLGILVLIPIIILLLVAAVSGIVSTAAHIAVESVTLSLKNGGNSLEFNLSDIEGVINLNDYLDIAILPERATNTTIEWTVLDVMCLDEEYENAYNNYLANKDTAETVYPAAMLVDENGNETESNITGKLAINAYCQFTVRASAETFSDSVVCYVVGYDVEKISLIESTGTDNAEITVGSSLKLYANVTPLDSIINDYIWESSDTSVAVVDKNGIVTAKKKGTASVKVKASVYSDETQYVESSEFYVNVVKAGSYFGSAFYSHLSDISLTEIGAVSASAVSGCTVSGDTLTISSSPAVITTDNGNVEIILCDENDIVIENAALLNSDSDEIAEVNGKKLILSAVYKSVFKEGKPDVSWSSADEDTATVNNGVVTALSKGLVNITAVADGKSAVIEINAQKKVTSMRLATSDTYYSMVIGGLAREHVFASMYYEDVASSNSNTKKANSTYIVIKGSEDLTGAALKEFNDAYTFEIKEGKDFAEFDEDEQNKLIFRDALEGQGVQEIKVRVSAKYPKYVTRTQYTQEEVTVKAVYGAEVNDIYELKTAALDQEEYAKLPGNVIDSKGDINTSYDLTYTDNPVEVSSKKLFSIVVNNNISYPKNLNDSFYTSSETFQETKCVSDVAPNLYGPLYGNNHSLNSWKEIMPGEYDCVLFVRWSGVKISNFTVKAVELDVDDEIVSGDETSELHGKCIHIGSQIDDGNLRFHDIAIEYCILENAYQLMSINNIDITYKGCVMRNLCSIGVYVPSWIRKNDTGTYKVMYSHVNAENCVISNALGSAFSIAQEGYSINPDDSKGWHSNNLAENEAYIRENFCRKGFCNIFNQKGFLDVYNWEPVSSAKLIQTGNDSLDSLIGSLTEDILSIKKLEHLRYRYKNEYYFNLGFLVSGLATSGGITVEPIFSEINLEDQRFSSFSLTDLKGEDNAIFQIASSFTLNIYGYNNQADLKPSSVYTVNEKLINRLHS